MKIRQSRDNYNIGANIRRFRIENGMTQEQAVAKMQLMGIDISRSIYSQIGCNIKKVFVAEEDILIIVLVFKAAEFDEVVVITNQCNTVIVPAVSCTC